MKYNQLGKTELQVSEIAFGCMSLEADQTVASHLIDQAIDGGINLFDTADLYQKGDNEEMVGTALKGKRDRLILATKVGNQWRTDGSGWDWNPRKAYILKAVESSLKRLQTDYIDLYQLHGGTIDDPIDETIEAFELLKSQGKIRAYGISSIRPNVIQAYINKSQIASNMTQYNLLDRRPEESTLSALKDAEIGVLVRGALAQGVLVGKSRDRYLDYDVETVNSVVKLVHELSVKYEVSPACIAMKFALHHQAVTSIVAGVRTEQQLSQVLQAGKASVNLEAEDLAKLAASVAPNYYQNHR
ncbi:MAG: aldo/keto reductase [Bacteroidota bacterium]